MSSVQHVLPNDIGNFFFVPSLPVHAPYMCTNKLPHAGFPLTPGSDTLLNVFLAIAVDNLANAQELTKVRCSPVRHRSLSISIPLLDGFLPSPPHSVALLSDFLPFRRMSRRKRRLPVRRLPCRKPRRWLKSAHCLLPTSPSQREFLSPLPPRSRVFSIRLKHFHTWQGFLRAEHLHVSLKKRIPERRVKSLLNIQ